MTFQEIMAALTRLSLRLDRNGTKAVLVFPEDPEHEALRELTRAADDGCIIEAPLRGDCETVEVPDLETVKMPKVT